MLTKLTEIAVSGKDILQELWIPAFAGMTLRTRTSDTTQIFSCLSHFRCVYLGKPKNHHAHHHPIPPERTRSSVFPQHVLDYLHLRAESDVPDSGENRG